MTENILTIGTLLVALIGSISGVYAVYIQRKEKKASADKLKEEAEKIAEEITEMVLRRAREEVRLLRCDNEYLAGENEALKARVTKLEAICQEIKALREENREVVEENLALKTRVEELERDYRLLLAAFKQLKEGVRLLSGQIRELGYEPVFVIEEDEPADE